MEFNFECLAQRLGCYFSSSLGHGDHFCPLLLSTCMCGAQIVGNSNPDRLQSSLPRPQVYCPGMELAWTQVKLRSSYL